MNKLHQINFIPKLDASGNVNEAEFTAFVKKIASGDHQAAIAENVAKKCIENAKTATDIGPKGDSNCSHTSMKLKFCVGGEFFKACPADKQDTSEKCTKIREHINSGKPMGPSHRGADKPEGSAENIE